MESCLWASSGTVCYKVNPNNFAEFTCPNKTYKDDVSYTCAACPLGCDLCVNASPYGCKSCSPGFVDVDGICECDTGTYYNWVLRICSKYEFLGLQLIDLIININVIGSCMNGCDSCTSSTDCSLCSAGYYLDSTSGSSGTCAQTCPSGYFGNETTRICDILICPENCLLCPDSVSCTQCEATHLLENGGCTTVCSSTNPIAFNGNCLNSCPQGYSNIVQSSTNTCILCDEGCLTCLGSAPDNCLTCNSSSFLQNGMCLPCNSSCETCSMDANNCTYCPSGTYLLESTCVSVCPGTVNEVNRSCAVQGSENGTGSGGSEPAPNSGCVPPMAPTNNGSCVYCGGNCAECSLDAQTCIACNPGLTLQNGACTLPSSQSIVTFQTGALKSLGALSLMQYSTSQSILAELSEDGNSVSDLKVFWILFATDIAPDYASLLCENIQEIVSYNYTQGFPTSILQMGNSGLGYINYTDSYGIYLQITGLRSALNYNFTVCIQQATKISNLWDSGSIEFKTKNNGYAIRKAKLMMDTSLPSEDLPSFLCALATALNISNSTITTSDGHSCNSRGARRLLHDDESQQKPTLSILNSNRRTLAATTSSNKLDLLIYGDPTSEIADSTTTQIAAALASESFLDSFVYSSSSTTVSSKGIVRITEVSIGQSIIPEAPVIVTETVSYEVKGNIMFFPNITFSGVDGYAYICLVPNNSQTDIAPPSSALIISSLQSGSQTTGDYIIERIRFFNGEAFAVVIEGIHPNTSYNIVIFGTNEDQSAYAFRSRRLIIQAILGTNLPKSSVELSYFTLIATEVGAVVFLIVTWIGLFTKIKIKFDKCRRCLQYLRPKNSQDEESQTQAKSNKRAAKYELQINNCSGTVVDPQCDETTRQFVSSRKSMNATTFCNEKLEIGTERVLCAESSSFSSCNIPVSGRSHFTHTTRTHIVDLSLLEVPDEDQDARVTKFDLMTSRGRVFQFMKP